MPVGIEAWITQIPPITRGWLGLSILTSLAVVRLQRDIGFGDSLTRATAMPTSHSLAAIFQPAKRVYEWPGVSYSQSASSMSLNLHCSRGVQRLLSSTLEPSH